MLKLKPYSASSLVVAGLNLAAIGLYFVFLRTPLLTEDLRYIGTTLQNVQEKNPSFLDWLQKVFWVMGGFIFATGVLSVFISITSSRARIPGAFGTVTLAGISSSGLLCAVNFIIGSDFRWP